ncbi:MAG: M17 family peptidase N-terminal domain-containing protein, partial [Oscillospiraceae bacterium]
SVPRSDAVVLPCFDPPEWMDGLPDAIRDAAVLAVDSKRFLGAEDSFYTLTFPWEGRLQSVVLAGLGKKEAVLSNRKVFLVMAAALRRCRDLKARTVAVCADNAPGVTDRPDLLRKLGELPYLVNYRFHRYQSGTKEEGFERASVVTRRETDMLSDEASICAESALLARDLTNQPANAMDPAGLGEQVRQIGARCGFSVEVLEPPEIEALGMNCFLAVGRGAQQTPPRLIVMRYAGGGDAPVVGLIGKGILFDSGGYCLKPGAGMKAMFDDMGGAAAVIGAISAAARMKLPVNIVSVVAACENKIGPDAFVPGDILQTMAGKSVEMLNTDAEGRLTLADAMT